jgi:flotillin
MARTAEVKRDARIGEAEARCDATIKEAIAEEQRMASRFLNDTDIAKAQRDFELKKAAYDVEVQTKKAEAEMAYELQAAKTKQRIKEEQMQIKVVERTQEILVQQQEMLRRERELEATVRRPAEAEKYRLEKLAEANKNRVILEAEAESEAVSYHNFYLKKYSPKIIFLQFKIKIRGEAESFAIHAKAKAEAEQMAKKAEAYKEYREAAMIEMLLETLPKVQKSCIYFEIFLTKFSFIGRRRSCSSVVASKEDHDGFIRQQRSRRIEVDWRSPFDCQPHSRAC